MTKANIDAALDLALGMTPTYVLANTLTTVLDLLPTRCFRDGDLTNIYCGVQLNGPPHLGTALTLLLTVAIAERALENGIFQPRVVIDILDNVSYDVTPNSASHRMFRRLLSHAVSPEDCFNIFERDYGAILAIIRSIPVTVHYRLLSQYQRSPEFRRALLKMLQLHTDLGQCLNPKSGRFPIRFSCPHCGLVEVHSSHTRMTKVSASAAQFSAYCNVHGYYAVEISENSPHFIDANSLLRNVIKDTENYLSGRPPAISVKGLDWQYGCEVLSRALSVLDIQETARPFRLFTPLVTDQYGAKLSKSFSLQLQYLLPSSEHQIGKFSPQIQSLFFIARGIIERPPLFFRSFTADYLLSLLSPSQTLE